MQFGALLGDDSAAGWAREWDPRELVHVLGGQYKSRFGCSLKPSLRRPECRLMGGTIEETELVSGQDAPGLAACRPAEVHRNMLWTHMASNTLLIAVSWRRGRHAGRHRTGTFLAQSESFLDRRCARALEGSRCEPERSGSATPWLATGHMRRDTVSPRLRPALFAVATQAAKSRHSITA
jgi:hypothetical protein